MDRYAGLEQESLPDDAMVGHVVVEPVHLCQVRLESTGKVSATT